MEPINETTFATDINVSEEQERDVLTQPAVKSKNNKATERAVTPSCASCKGKSEGGEGGCSCGCGGQSAQSIKVYAIGTLGHEFQSEANRDAFLQDMDGGNPDDPNQLISYLRQNPEAAEDVIWTLNVDASPIYAICPQGGYASILNTRIIEFYQSQIENRAHRVSIPGLINGNIHLMSGQELPVIYPKGQAMYSWSTEEIIKAVVGAAPKKDAKKKPGEESISLVDFNKKQEGLENFLARVYYDLRNFGITSEDRALNFAATNAFNAEKVFEKSANAGLELDTIEVEKSPICRPNSDCWDIKLTFFNPTRRMEEARKVYRFTVDVSYVIPVAVGPVRSWSVF
jgi:cyanobactin maturation PatA/PatG family protease